MNFRRIDKNTVQCRMSEEEMEEYGFKIEDFFTDQDKAREFLEQLVERAEEEVGYEVEGGVVSMQLMRMPDNSLIITFSDQSPEGMNNMLNQIRHLAGSIDDETAEAIVEGLKNGEIPDVDDQAAIHTSENMDLFQKKNTVDADKENYQKHMKDATRKAFQNFLNAKKVEHTVPEQEQKPQWVCSVCGYVYDGDEPFEKLPETWQCPRCGQPKSVFVRQ